jgi:AcrR family transcriptional regulator
VNPVPADVIRATLHSAERLGRDVADVQIVVIAHALGVSRSTLLRQLGGSRRALDNAVRDLGVDPGGRPPVRHRAIHAAAVLIGSSGVASATLEAIAEDADCSVHSLHATFGGREGLLLAVYDQYIPQLDLKETIAAASDTDLVDTVRAIYRLLVSVFLDEPRVLAAVLAETLARPTGSGAGVLIEHGALWLIAGLDRWLDDEVVAGRVRDLPRQVLIQQLISPISVHCIMRPGLVSFPQVTSPDLAETCDAFADAFVRAVAP